MTSTSTSKEERETLQIAIQGGISVESARASPHQVCDARVGRSVSCRPHQLRTCSITLAGNDGQIERERVQRRGHDLHESHPGTRSDLQANAMVVEIIEETLYADRPQAGSGAAAGTPR